MAKKQMIGAVTLSLFILALVGGCNWFSYQRKPDTAMPPPGTSQTAATEPQITVYMHETGEVKPMMLEDYLAGVVAGEMKPDWPVEALAAQAILARTFTLAAIETKGGVPGRNAQASTDIKEFQAYDAKAVNDNVRQAIALTRGKVVTYQGNLITAWFHASAGGQTALAKEGLNYKEPEPPYIVSVASPDDLAPADIQNWQANISQTDFLAAMGKIGHPVPHVDSLEITAKGASGRTTEFTVNKTVKVNGPDLRVAIGGTTLKSMLLDKVSVNGDHLLFVGRGYGHGVGLSQWGAYSLAKAGKKSDEIIAAYYTGVTIEQRYP